MLPPCLTDFVEEIFPKVSLLPTNFVVLESGNELSFPNLRIDGTPMTASQFQGHFSMAFFGSTFFESVESNRVGSRVGMGGWG